MALSIFRNICKPSLTNSLRVCLEHNLPSGYYSWFKQAIDNFDSGVRISSEANQYKISINVQSFSPNEITVKTVNDNTIVVEAKHESKPDEHGYIFRHFTRKYIIPPGHDVKKIVSSLTQDGVLTVIAPKTTVEKEKVVPILKPNEPPKPSDTKPPVRKL